jgi:hypothetical protein
MLNLLSERLGVSLEKRRFPLPEGGWLEIDGACDQPPILCEAWAHQGPAKAAQKHKLMTDAVKLLYAAKLMGAPPCLILLFADETAAAHLRGRSWMGQMLKGNGVNIEVVALPSDLRESIRAAQVRQFR